MLKLTLALQTQINNLKTQILSLQDQLLSEQEKVSNLSKSISEKNSQGITFITNNSYLVELFTAQLVERKEELDKLTQEFEDHRNQTEQESHQLLLNHQKEISELQVEIKKLEGDKEEANEKLDNLHNK